MKTKTCRTSGKTPTARGLADKDNAVWNSAIGPIPCVINAITYDETHRCWNALVTLTADRDWHKAGKTLATHLDNIDPQGE